MAGLVTLLLSSILGSRRQHVIGILLMLYGCFFSPQFIGGVVNCLLMPKVVGPWPINGELGTRGFQKPNFIPPVVHDFFIMSVPQGMKMKFRRSSG